MLWLTVNVKNMVRQQQTMQKEQIQMKDEITMTQALPSEGSEQNEEKPVKDRKVQLGISRFPDSREVKFDASLNDSILQVFNLGSEALATPLLPPNSSTPLDLLRSKEGKGWSDPIQDLGRPLWLLLESGASKHFSIEYVLAIKINTKWGVAPSPNATPRQLLEGFGFNPAEFSLYRVNSADLLPSDAPLLLARGDVFEAQKDGRYGSTMNPGRCSQTIEDDVEATSEAGLDARLLIQSGQKYVEVRLDLQTPPWSRNMTRILIAVPSNYPAGGLDAFYLEQGLTHVSGSIPGQQSTVIIDGRTWVQISWHYTPNRQWNPLHDDLASHVVHCRGYFLNRGVSQ
jgi:hypothetical protein